MNKQVLAFSSSIHFPFSTVILSTLVAPTDFNLD